MCNPTISLGLQAAQTAYSTVGSFYAAKAEKSAYQTKATINDINAGYAELNAQLAIRAGQREEQRTRLNTAQLKGRQRAAMGANGIALDSEAALNILTTTDVMGEVDANTISANAARQAWGYRQQAAENTAAGVMNRASAKGIRPFMSGATTLLTGATKVASNYMDYKRAGMFE